MFVCSLCSSGRLPPPSSRRRHGKTGQYKPKPKCSEPTSAKQYCKSPHTNRNTSRSEPNLRIQNGKNCRLMNKTTPQKLQEIQRCFIGTSRNVHDSPQT